MRVEHTARLALRSDGPGEEPVYPATQTPAVRVKEEDIPSFGKQFQYSASRFRMFQLLIVTLADKYQPSDSLLESMAMFEQSRVPPGIIRNLMFYS